jgi:hypothetical protein
MMKSYRGVQLDVTPEGQIVPLLEVKADGSISYKGEGAGHPFRGNQWTSGQRASAAQFGRQVLSHPDGFTLEPFSSADVTTGYACAISNHLSKVVDYDRFESDKNFREKTIKDYMRLVREAAKTNPEVKFGGWTDTTNNKVVLDHTEMFSNTEEGKKLAIAAGQDRDQRAIFHIDTMTEIPIGGTGGY